jgi:hypothetical protein
MNTPTDYPLPTHAAYIWTNGEHIFMTFPGYRGAEDRRFNTVQLKPQIETNFTCKCGKEHKIRNNVLEVLWDVLKSRANSKEGKERFIGSRATPTQWNIDEVLKAMKVTKVTEPKISKKKRELNELLEKIGL